MGTVHAKSIGPDEGQRIDLSSIKAVIQRVNVDGLGRTKDDIVISSIQHLFSTKDFPSMVVKIHEACSKLENLGCFKSVGVLVDAYKGEDAVDDGVEVTFTVSEYNLLGARVNTSVGTNEGSLTTGGMLKNVFGRGEELSSEYSYGTRKTSSFFTTFTKPFHNDSNSVLKSSIYQQNNEMPWSSYRELDRGLLMSLAFDSFPNARQKIVLDNAWRHLMCLSRSTAFAVREQVGHSLKSSIRHELSFDKRDDNIFPTDGIAFLLKNEFAGLGGDTGFLKNEIDLQVNVPLPFDVAVQGSFQAGHLLPLRNNKLHYICDRFFLGGPTTIRGFEMAGVGPHSDGFALGSEMYWAAALHLFSPLPLLAKGGTISEKFRLHGFVNIGNIGNFISSDVLKNNLESVIKEMRLSYGIGLAMSLAGIARVELNYCIPLLVQRGDRPNYGVQFGVAAQFL